MIRLALRALCCSFVLTTSAVAGQFPMQFGEQVQNPSVTQVAEILQAPERYLDLTLSVSGVVTNSCEKEGCWMTLETGNQGVFRIKVDDGVMVFPISARGRTAIATGTLSAVPLSDDRQAALKEQGIVTEVMYQLVPDSVRVL
ncbi:MAG: DUF4920 domain-containing protein [Idiomarina sp.]|nr:DUF4920 domain-containing protein [Idiomarina sp.]